MWARVVHPTVDHSALLIEYLDTTEKPDLPELREEAPSADTLPAWGEVAPTEIAAPSFAQLQREQDVDVEVARFVEGALVEHDESNIDSSVDINIDIEPARVTDDRVDEWVAEDSLEVDLLYLEPSSERAEPELEIAIDIDLVTEDETLHLDVEIAQHSDSHIWEGLDGEYGVFLATYQTLPLGTQVQLTVHLMDRTFHASATVRWVRNENTGIWPGLGLELDVVTAEVAKTIERFALIRPAMFHCF